MKATHTAIRNAATLVTLVGAAALTTGCGLFSSKAATGVANVDELQSSIERVHVESELAQQRVRDTADLLTTLVTGNYQGEPTDVYLRLVSALDESEGQANKLRKAIADMKSSAAPVFENWQNDLLKITSPNLRRQSEDRLDQTRARFDFVASAARSAETGVDTFNQGTRDITLFLGSDFNPSAISAVEPEAREVDGMSIDVDDRLRRAQEAVQEYMQASGLPLDGDTFAAPPGGAPEPRNARPEPRRDNSSGSTRRGGG